MGILVLDGPAVRPDRATRRDQGQVPVVVLEAAEAIALAPLAKAAEPVAGLAPGVRVATARGWRRIEALEPGDRVMTRDNGLVTVVAVAKRRAAAAAVVTLQPGDVRGLDATVALGSGTAVLWTGGRVDEALGTREGLLAARDLGTGTVAEQGFVTLFLPVLARQEVIFAEGMAVATALPEGGLPARPCLTRAEAQRVLRA
jgi:hypothetical protein